MFLYWNVYRPLPIWCVLFSFVNLLSGLCRQGSFNKMFPSLFPIVLMVVLMLNPETLHRVILPIPCLLRLYFPFICFINQDSNRQSIAIHPWGMHKPCSSFCFLPIRCSSGPSSTQITMLWILSLLVLPRILLIQPLLISSTHLFTCTSTQLCISAIADYSLVSCTHSFIQFIQGFI